MPVVPMPKTPAPAPRDTVADANTQAIIADQVELLAAQAVAVRHLEDTLHLSTPPGPATPVPPLAAGVDLTQYMQTQLAAIRSQQAYINNLNALLTMVPTVPW